LRQSEYYEKHNIQFELNTTITELDRESRTLRCDNNKQFQYTKLALATGARVRTIDLPGSELGGVHYLRTASDALALKQQMTSANHAVIVGGGYIGLELAASFRKTGINVTVLEMADRVLARVAAKEVADFYTRVHTEEGVKILTNTSADSFTGKNQVESVHTTNGNTIPADIVVIGVGVVPNMELAAESGLSVGNGIVVNEYAQTTDPDIVAAGDCTFHPNALLNTELRLESVPNATEQAKSAAASMCGLLKPYSSLPWFWSDQFDVKLQIAGVNTGYDNVIVRGDSTGSRSFAAFYIKNNRVIAADCINRAKEFSVVKRSLSKNLDLNIENISNESIDIKDMLV